MPNGHLHHRLCYPFLIFDYVIVLYASNVNRWVLIICEEFVKIKYLHINRESVLPLGKDTVQIHPIPPRFIDTVFSIGYIVGDISKKELTAMPRINDGRKKFIAFILIIILSFLGLPVVFW